MNLIPYNATLLQALERLNALPGNAMTLFVTDSEGRVTGSLTDGDIRRAIVSGHGLESTVDSAARRNFKALRGDGSDVELMRECRRLGIKLVPRLNPDGTPAEIVDLSVTRSRLPLSAVLMAGGRGERLRPLTLTVPKPLLKIEDKAIIDYNIEALAAVGIKDITVTTGYLADQIAEHFASPVAGVHVKTVCEPMPLGTVGAARLAGLSAEGNTLVMNSDLITTISFEELYLKHRDTGADATVAVIPYQVSVPYAILSIDGDRVSGIEEKPSYSYYANAGIYIFNNRRLNALPANRRTDATDLVADIIADGGRVSYYPIKGTWIDVGSPVDFRQAAELMKHHNNLSNT